MDIGREEKPLIVEPVEDPFERRRKAPAGPQEDPAEEQPETSPKPAEKPKVDQPA